MSSIPKVSVVMPAFNSERYICDAIASVRNQTFDEWELIVVDDCSTDGTYEKLCEYCKSFKGNAKVVRNEKNQGPGLSRNHGIKEANGKYIMFLDSDDYFEQKAAGYDPRGNDSDYLGA